MPHTARGGTQRKGASRTGSARCEVRAEPALQWHWTGETGYPKIGRDDRSSRFAKV
jgi:hypothetical protein